MKYELISTKLLLSQLESLSKSSLNLLKSKILMLETNPGRFKKIVGFPHNLFRIRFEDLNKEKRLIYVVEGKFVKLLCILDRDKDYKDLRNYLKQFEKTKEL